VPRTDAATAGTPRVRPAAAGDVVADPAANALATRPTVAEHRPAETGLSQFR
jgi:hypothetical protein